MQQVLIHFARNFTLEFLAIPPRFLFFCDESNIFLNESIQPFSGRGCVCSFFSLFESCSCKTCCNQFVISDISDILALANDDNDDNDDTCGVWKVKKNDSHYIFSTGMNIKLNFND